MSENAQSPYPWKVLEPSTDWIQRTMVFYGPSGCGKTYLAGQFPSPLFLACDPGVLGGAISALKFGIKHVKVNSYQEVLDLLEILQKTAGTEFKTLVVDSISYMGKLCLAAILKNAFKEIPKFEEWGLNYVRMARLINNLSELKCHIIFNAIDKIDKDEVTGKMLGGPMLPGQLAKELPQAVDVCARLFTSTAYDNSGKLKTKYMFRTVPDDLYFAKDRTQLLAAEGPAEFASFKCLFREDELNP